MTALIVGVPMFGILLFRVGRFKLKLTHFLRQILAGNYEAGVRTSQWVRDEVTVLEDMINKHAEHLRAYDKLRAERVATSARALDLLLFEVPCPVAAADIQKTVLRLNPSARSVFDVEQESFSFEALENQPPNAPFLHALESVRAQSKETLELDAALQFPGREARGPVNFKFVPVTGRGDEVNMVLVFIRP